MSEWGHDFRPDYLRLASVIAELGHPPVMACTATATPKVAEEIVARLGLREPERVRSGFDRPNLSFDVLPFDGEGSVARKRATLVAGLRHAREPPRGRLLRHAQEHRGDRRAARRGGPARRRLPRGHGRRRRAPRARTRSCAARPTSSSRRTRSAWASTRPTCARSGTGRCRRASRPTTRRRAAPAATARPARAVLLASRSDLGRLVRFIQRGRGHGRAGRRARRAPARRAVGRRRSSSTPGDDRDRIALAVAERAGALRLAPGARRAAAGRARATATSTTAAPPQMCRAATDRRWQAYRSIERYAADARAVPPPPAPRPLRRPDAGRAARPLLRRPRPARLAAADHGGRQARRASAAAGRRRPAGRRRRPRAAEGLAPRPRRRQARVHGRHRRDAARDRAPPAAERRRSCWRSRASARRSSASTPTRCSSCCTGERRLSRSAPRRRPLGMTMNLVAAARAWDVCETPARPAHARRRARTASAAISFPGRGGPRRGTAATRDARPRPRPRSTRTSPASAARSTTSPSTSARARSSAPSGRRCSTIPYGETVSYGELARAGRPARRRPGRRAPPSAARRCPIVVPCHRVIGADGALTGYGGGLQRKQALLDLERRGRRGPRARAGLGVPAARAALSVRPARRASASRVGALDPAHEYCSFHSLQRSVRCDARTAEFSPRPCGRRLTGDTAVNERILIIDDDAVVQDVARASLERDGYIVHIARAGGDEGLAMTAARAPGPARARPRAPGRPGRDRPAGGPPPLAGPDHRAQREGADGGARQGPRARRRRLPAQAVQPARARRAREGAAAARRRARRRRASCSRSTTAASRSTRVRHEVRVDGSARGAHAQRVRPAASSSPSTPAASTRARRSPTGCAATTSRATSA